MIARTMGQRARAFGDQRGFTLIEVLTAIVVLGIVGAAATHLVIRLTTPREATVRYEQLSLAARVAAEQIWALFAQSTEGAPAQCLPFSEDPPPPEAFEPVDVNFEFAFRCGQYVEDGNVSDTLYQVLVWLRRKGEVDAVGTFEMLALVGGY